MGYSKNLDHIGNHVNLNGFQGFESLLLRQKKKPVTVTVTGFFLLPWVSLCF